ncbi:MAG TPA: asparagine synthase (glutamine-hydrolyzing) [Chloroflexota bacterium]|nr:asparagine synthase (glutamine-hydrolyzing) [Chloroflexota bacterium]
MCGIAGIYRFDRQPVPLQDVTALEAMAASQHHRGPDAGGQAVMGCCALASQRLSILDLSPLGHMPMRSEDGGLALITNGEIYNYVEVRAELRELGHVFRSDGDTEVILRAYQQWGAACVERFVGMWAFALFDTVGQTLLLSRDRLGVKPIYVHRTPERLVFASEIKGIVTYLRQVGESVRANPTSIATYVATGLVDGQEQTFFDGVTRFPAAATMQVRPQGVRTKTYWDLPSRVAARGASINQNGASQAPWVAVRQALDEAVRVHLRSDVPLGVCLSGGLDSSAIVGLASRYVERVKTFTVYFGDGPAYDERQHAHPIVEQFGAEASERGIEPTDVLGTLKDIVWHLDEPSLALGVYPQWHVMQLARDAGVKVVLDGQGGDEVFAGYANYAPQQLYGLLGANPMRFPVETAALARLQGFSAARSAARSALAMRLRGPVTPTIAHTPDAALLAPELRDLADVSHNEWRLWPRVFDGWLNNVLYWELTRTRLPALLRYEDRLSMAFSIESRVPFLDHRLVELAFALPDEFKRHAGWSKYGLRRALEGLLPPGVVWRRDKKGFPTPVGAWLRDGRASAATDLLSDPRRKSRYLFPQAAVDRFVGEHHQGVADRSWQLWRALSTELWLEAFELA